MAPYLEVLTIALIAYIAVGMLVCGLITRRVLQRRSEFYQNHMRRRRDRQEARRRGFKF